MKICCIPCADAGKKQMMMFGIYRRWFYAQKSFEPIWCII
jgi:hypothetical protein